MADREAVRHRVVCIVCPEGCELDIEERNGELLFPSHACRRGREYAQQEIRDPRRVLTTTVRVRGGEIAMLPVRSAEPLRRGDLERAVRELSAVEVEAPVRMGEVVHEDVADSGVAVVACRTVGATASPPS